MKYLLIALFFVGCSSAPEKKAKTVPDTITNESFKKEKPLSNREVSDFYQGNARSLTPALQDETMDRFSESELSQINTSGDPLLEISVLCGRRNFDQAFAVAAKSFDRYQKVAAYWNQVANCHLNSGSHRKALLFYNKALDVSPHYVPALNNIGVMYSRQGQDQKALVAFERANKRGKFSKTPRYNLAKLYLSYGLSDSALPIFESLLREAPNDVDILNAVASSHFLGADYQRALAYYDKIPQTEWRRAEIGLNLAWTLKNAGRNNDARQVFSMVSKPSSENLRRYYGIVEAHLGAN